MVGVVAVRLPDAAEARLMAAPSTVAAVATIAAVTNLVAVG